MAKLDARSIVIILASFGLVAGTLILVQKRNGPPEPPASGSQSMAAPPSAPIELLGSGPTPAPAPAPVTAPTPQSASVVSAPQHAIPAGSSAPASAARPIVVASSAKPASVSVPAPSGTAKQHAIPAESEPAPASTSKPASVTTTPVKPVPAPVKPVSVPVKVAPAGHYFLQAGAFRDENNALKLIARLNSLGFKATESTVGELHKVLVGPYPTSDAAIAAKTKLKAQGIDSAFVAKS